MTEHNGLSGSFNSLLYRSHPYVIVNLFASLLFLLVRGAELVSVAGAQGEGVPFFPLVVQALWIDLLTIAAAMLLLTIVYFILASLASDRTAMKVHCALLSVTALVLLGVTRYFTITLVPLGADLYGYSLSDIAETVSASGGLGIGVPLAMAAVVTLIFLLPRFALRFPAPRQAVIAFYIVCASSMPLLALFHPAPSDLPNENAYHIVENKTAEFVRQSFSYAVRTMLGAEGTSEMEFPFLHPADDRDVLGPYFTPGSARPNIVMIIVEGLGSAFVRDGTYEGFTPFIDSLSRSGLYWRNFLSTSGRTFGVLPAITASLPANGQGFMELGAAMPEHRSLFTILRENGYRTAYYYGGKIDFDNQNMFLERQGVQTIVDAGDFPPQYVRSAATPEGFSWGYADGDLFKRSLEVIGTNGGSPRFDVYTTLSTHEPFIPPNAPLYRAAVDRIIAASDMPEGKRSRIEQHKDIFASLLYTDAAVRSFVAAYAKRPEYANTIFIITGDHRLIPVPMESKIDRYRVPFIIASPMLKRTKEFNSVSTHADVVPTLLGFLKKNYSIDLPSMVHWIGTPVDTAAEFRNLRSRAFMQYKGEVTDYISGRYFLSGDRIFQLNSRLYADEITDNGIRDSLRALRDDYLRLVGYVMTQNKLMPSVRKAESAKEDRNDDSLFALIDRWGMNSDALFNTARDTAFKQFYAQARIICRRLLARNPDYHDVRALMASTFAWEHRYEEARNEFNEIVRRSPNYPDAYFGLARVEFWNGNMDGALQQIITTIGMLPRDPFARLLKAKIEFTMGRDADALKELEFVLAAPRSEATAEAAALKKKYQSGRIR